MSVHVMDLVRGTWRSGARGRFEMVGDPSKPWYCWPGDTDASAEPIHTNFY